MSAESAPRGEEAACVVRLSADRSGLPREAAWVSASGALDAGGGSPLPGSRPQAGLVCGSGSLPFTLEGWCCCNKRQEVFGDIQVVSSRFMMNLVLWPSVTL